MKRKINTTMDDLMMAFDMNPDEHLQYLNLETGDIAIISEKALSRLSPNLPLA